MRQTLLASAPVGPYYQDNAILDLCSACVNPTNVFSTYELFKPGTETKIYNVRERTTKGQTTSPQPSTQVVRQYIIPESGQICIAES